MNSHKINIKELYEEPGVFELMNALEKGLFRYGIDFYFIGTIISESVDNQSLSEEVIEKIDFVIFINDKNAYVNLISYLINTQGFYFHQNRGFALCWKNGKRVNLIPFDEIDAKPHSTVIYYVGRFSMHISEVKKETDVDSSNKLYAVSCGFKFCELSEIILFRLLAFQDNPKIGRDYIGDISKILKCFFEMYANLIYKEHANLFTGSDANPIWISARVIGRDLAKLTQLNKKNKQVIDALLINREINSVFYNVPLLMSSFFQNTTNDCVKILEQMKKGYLE
jgi:hypothetical protein